MKTILGDEEKPGVGGRARFTAGFFATLLLIILLFLGRLLVGSPIVPELMANRLFGVLPISVIEFGVQALGIYAKKIGFLGCVLLFIAIHTHLNAWLFRLIGDLEQRPIQFAIFLYAATLWYTSLSLLIPGFALGVFTGVSFQMAVAAMVLLAIYILHAVALGPVLSWFVRQPQRRSLRMIAGRRMILASLGFTLLSSFVYTFLGKFAAEIRHGVAGRVATTGGAFPDLQGLAMEVTPTVDFYYVSKNIVDPEIDGDAWSVEIGGLVDRPLRFTYADIRAMNAVEQYATLMCISNPVGGDLIGNAKWKGVRLSDLLEKVGVQPSVRDVALHAADGYADSISLERALRRGTLLCYEMNGKPLTPTHGFPARLLVPAIYGMKNVKWVTRIELVNYDYKGYWQTRGWDDQAEYKTMSRIDLPPEHIPAAPATIAGIAFAGDRGIARVECSKDGGDNWEAAEIRPPLSLYSWVLWQHPWAPGHSGKFELQVRTTDGRGVTQPAERTGPIPAGASGYHRRLVKVV